MWVIRVITSRPVVMLYYLITLFLWVTIFFYLVPKATGGWFAWTVSIAFGCIGALPMLAVGANAIWRTVRGLPLEVELETVCPHCGRPYEEGIASGPVHHDGE